MKTKKLLQALIFTAPLLPLCHGATVFDHFETGEDTSAWNASWTNGTTAAGFLDPSLGGETAGSGTSEAQTFSRNFRNNTADLSVTTA